MIEENIADVSIQNEGSLFLFFALTQSARDWIEENVAEPRWWGNALVVEHSYAQALAEGMAGDGLNVR
jgi:hypothetical protein